MPFLLKKVLPLDPGTPRRRPNLAPLLPLSRLPLLIEGGAVRGGVSYFATPCTAAAKGGGWLGLNVDGGLKPRTTPPADDGPSHACPADFARHPTSPRLRRAGPRIGATPPLRCRCFAKPVTTGFCERKTDRCSLPPQGAGSSDPAGMTKLHKRPHGSAEAPGMTRTALDAVAPGGGRASIRCGRHERRSRSAIPSASRRESWGPEA